jgi:formylglycine-generating enzyme required for sulfatase activity
VPAVAGEARTATPQTPSGPPAGISGAPPRWRRRRTLIAGGVALGGAGVALALYALYRAPGDRRRSSELETMVRFPAANIQIRLFAAARRPKECSRPQPDNSNCEEWLDPDTARMVHVDMFDLDRTEVTNEDFAAWLNATSGKWGLGANGFVTENADGASLIQTRPEQCPAGLSITPEHHAQTTDSSSRRPVVCVTWYAAYKYCRAQNNKRLPTETEWELAARGVDGRPFPWGTDPPERDRVAYGGLPAPRDVGTSAQDISLERIHDLAGNVAEWVVSDTDTAQLGTVRGGTYLSEGPCRVLGSRCVRLHPGRISESVGFRCARDVTTSTR